MDDRPTVDSEVMDDAEKRISMGYGVRCSDDHTMVLICMPVAVREIALTPYEARRMSGMLRRMAAGCVHEKRTPAPPPIRVKE